MPITRGSFWFGPKRVVACLSTAQEPTSKVEEFL